MVYAVRKGSQTVTLEEAKNQVLQKQNSYLSMMLGWIEDPSTLRVCGYKTLEEALSKTVLHLNKETEKIYRQYERENP